MYKEIQSPIGSFCIHNYEIMDSISFISYGINKKSDRLQREIDREIEQSKKLRLTGVMTPEDVHLHIMAENLNIHLENGIISTELSILAVDNTDDCHVEVDTSFPIDLSGNKIELTQMVMETIEDFLFGGE